MSQFFQFPSRFTIPWEFPLAFSDETTAFTTGTKITVQFPFDVVIPKYFVQVTTAPTGSSLIVDVQKAGVSVFSKAITVPVSAFNSSGGAVSYVVNDSFIPAFTSLAIVINQIGATVAGAGGKLWFIGYRANPN